MLFWNIPIYDSEETHPSWEAEEIRLSRKHSSLLAFIGIILFCGTVSVTLVFFEIVSASNLLLTWAIAFSNLFFLGLQSIFRLRGEYLSYAAFIGTFACLGYFGAINNDKTIVDVFVIANITNFIAGTVLLIWKFIHSLIIFFIAIIINISFYFIFSSNPIDWYIGSWLIVFPVGACTTFMAHLRYAQTRRNHIYNIRLAQNRDQIEKTNIELGEKHEELTAAFEDIKSMNDVISEKNEAQLASLRYASFIQVAFLPSKEFISRLLNEYFIFYKPRDIISGDFYWINTIDNKTIVIVGDCTGHGVPGALLTMLGGAALTDIVLNKNISSPAQILNLLRQKIHKELNQDFTKNRDGMDISILVLDKENELIQYAGSKSTAYFVTQNSNFKVKSERFGIGGTKMNVDKLFTNQDFKYSEVKRIYMFTDGFFDQFGTHNIKKYNSTRFYEKLDSIQNLNMKAQQKELSTEFDQWKGNNVQIDDVLVFGIEV